MYDAEEGWGDDPPFGVPVFVLTSRPHERVVKRDSVGYTWAGPLWITPGLARRRTAIQEVADASAAPEPAGEEQHE